MSVLHIHISLGFYFFQTIIATNKPIMPRKKKSHQSDLTPLEGEEGAGSGGGEPYIDESAPAAPVPDATAIAMPAEVTSAQLPSGDTPAPARAPSASQNPKARAPAPPPPDSSGPQSPGHVAVPVESEPPPPPPEEQPAALSKEDVQAGAEAGVVSSSGEIEVLFIEKLAPEYECLHCRSVLRFPMKIKQCGHRVCSSCLQAFLECAAPASAPLTYTQ